MEKIYMDNNSSKNNFNGKYHFSIILSFIVAVFAIVSLIAVGFNQISFAAPNDGTAESDTFKLAAKYRKQISGENKVIKITSFVNAGDNSDPGYGVPIMYVADSSYNPDALSPDINSIESVFCFGKKDDEAGDGLDYTSSGVVNIQQHQREIAYILNNSGALNSDKSIIPRGTGGDYYKYLEIYATQVAIWTVLGDPSITTFENDIKNAKDYAITINQNFPVETCHTGELYSYIDKVVREAQSNTYTYEKTIKVDLGSTTSDVEGTNYVQSSLVQVIANPASDLISYDMSVSGIEGIIVVDENGKELQNLTGLTPSDKFYLRIPKDKIGNGSNEAVVHVSARFTNALVPYLYKNDGHQDIVRRKPGDALLEAQQSLVLVSSPDTKASTSQTIYFIGLVVLLCGVGIIYANSKAIKNV